MRKQFTGYERDDEADLDFAQSRSYSYKLGRFLSVDPLMGDSGDIELPQSLNLYAYVMNRPTIYVDPTGLRWMEDSRDPGGPVWVTESEWEAMSEDTKVFYRNWTTMEFNSTEGRIRLDPNGPSAENPGGYTRIGDNIFAGAGDAVLAAGTVAVSDGPQPGPLDLIALFYLQYAVLINQAQNRLVSVPAHRHSTLLNESDNGGKNDNSGSKTSESLTPKVKSKLGGLADKAGQTVAEVIKSRGGTAAVVGQAGHWAGKTLGETAAAAVAGDKSAETAIKCAKQAGRLGQKH